MSNAMMTGYAFRLARYEWQNSLNGRKSLTPAQTRRARKKLGYGLARMNLISVRTVKR